MWGGELGQVTGLFGFAGVGMGVAEVVAVGVCGEYGESDVAGGVPGGELEFHGEVLDAVEAGLEDDGALALEDVSCPLGPVGVCGVGDAFAAGAPGGFEDIGVVGVGGEVAADLLYGVADVGGVAELVLDGDGGGAAGLAAQQAEPLGGGYEVVGEPGLAELVCEGGGPSPGGEADVCAWGDV